MGASHSHDSVPERATPAQRRWLAAVLVPLVVATLAGLAAFAPRGGAPDLRRAESLPDRLVSGRVQTVTELPCADDPATTCRLVDVEVTEGPDRGFLAPLDLTAEGPRLSRGDRVILGYEASAEPGLRYFLVDRERTRPLSALAAVFALVVVLVGRRRGVAALVGLGATLAILRFFVLPALLDGRSPLGVAITGAAAIMLVTLYATHGFSARTSTAVLGTLGALALTGTLAGVFVTATRFSGQATDEENFLGAIADQVDVRGLLLAGIIIGALGVLDDVTITQASAVWELRAANAALGARALYAAAMRIGRAHIASTVNTLVLAYAGASLPLLVLFTVGGRSLGQVVSSEVVAQEVVRTLVGSLGLIAAVPLTTALAAVAVTRGDSGDAEPSPAPHESVEHEPGTTPASEDQPRGSDER